jgi:acyl-CoA synthetase (AMP-forming)/AMP-acid ligase II
MFPTLSEALLAAPAERPFVTFWKDEDDIHTATFGDFRERAWAQAEFLRSRGLKKGDTVILVMQQGIPLMSAFAGAMLLGAIPAILAYPSFKVEPAKYRMGLRGVSANLRARLVVVDQEFPTDLLAHLSAGEDSILRASGAERPSEEFERRCDGQPHETAFIQHSAGTTGLQKGVALSHEAVLRQLSHLVPALAIRPEDRIYSWLPLYHDMGLIACFILPMVCHIPVVMQAPTDWVMQPGTMLDLISQFRCSLAWAPNFTLQFLARRVRAEDREALDLSSMRAIINCSEPIRACSMDEFTTAFGKCKLSGNVLQSSYAMAETVFAITQSDLDDPRGPRRVWIDGSTFAQQHRAVEVRADTPGAVCHVSSGRCLPGSEVRILDKSGKDLEEGWTGEILIRSDSLLTGYYNRPDLTEKAMCDGWYVSGDLGFLLDGELYVVGRKKDLIIVAGKNIYPQDIEEIVCRHPAIYDGRVVAMGVYNDALGTEDIVAVAELRDPERASEAAVISQTVRTAITSELGVTARAVYLKPPRWIVKSTAGKPARSATRAKLFAEHPELGAQYSRI